MPWPDDQVGQRGVEPGQRVTRRRGQRQQRTLRAPSPHRSGPPGQPGVTRWREAPPNRPAHVAGKAVGTRHEDMVADPEARCRPQPRPPRQRPRSPGPADSPCRERAASCRTRTAFRCRWKCRNAEPRPPGHPRRARQGPGLPAPDLLRPDRMTAVVCTAAPRGCGHLDPWSGRLAYGVSLTLQSRLST